jgi:hypothetical protein
MPTPLRSTLSRDLAEAAEIMARARIAVRAIFLMM